MDVDENWKKKKKKRSKKSPMNFYIQIEITIEFKYLVSVKQSIWGKQE